MRRKIDILLWNWNFFYFSTVDSNFPALTNTCRSWWFFNKKKKNIFIKGQKNHLHRPHVTFPETGHLRVLPWLVHIHPQLSFFKLHWRNAKPPLHIFSRCYWFRSSYFDSSGNRAPNSSIRVICHPWPNCGRPNNPFSQFLGPFGLFRNMAQFALGI